MRNIDRGRGRARRRGLSLVEVLIVVSIMALVSSVATLFVIPAWKKARVRTAAVGAESVREAAQLYREVDQGGDGVACPTAQDLVAARAIEAKKSLDPWGAHYNVTCDEELHGVSSGSDRKPSTPDDVRDDVTPADVERISRM